MLQVDPEIFEAITSEVRRQQTHLELIASENFVSLAVLEALGSVLTNKYAEGYPGARYYGGCGYVDRCEQLAIERAKELFGAEHANVQPHSGTQANMAAYAALLDHGDPILAMDLDQGGHLSHGFRLNFSGQAYRTSFYGVNRDTETIDYDEVRQLAIEHQPRLIVAGASAYTRTIDFSAFAAIAQEVGAYLMADIAHIAGMVAAGLHPDPMPHCDVVTATTHKTMRGPRGGIILCPAAHAKDIDHQVFPGIQGGPLMHVIAAKAIALKEALAPSFRSYQEQILKNAQALANGMAARGYRVVSGGTDNHIVLVDLSSQNISGRKATNALERVGITVNKNLIPYDPLPPTQTSGIRLGSPALTSRRMRESEMGTVCDLIHQVLSAPDDEDVNIEVAQQVHELCEAFPLYQRSYHMYT